MPGRPAGARASGDCSPVSWPHLRPKPRWWRWGSGLLLSSSSPNIWFLPSQGGVNNQGDWGPFQPTWEISYVALELGLGLPPLGLFSFPSSFGVYFNTWSLPPTLVSILSLVPLNPVRLIGLQ